MIMENTYTYTKEEIEKKLNSCLAIVSIKLLRIFMLKPNMSDEDIEKEYDGIFNDCMSVFTRDKQKAKNETE